MKNSELIKISEDIIKEGFNSERWASYVPRALQWKQYVIPTAGGKAIVRIANTEDQVGIMLVVEAKDAFRTGGLTNEEVVEKVKQLLNDLDIDSE